MQCGKSRRRTPIWRGPLGSGSARISSLRLTPRKVVYYWGYPMVDVTGRTGQWQVMNEPGLLAGLVPAAPMGHIG